MEIDPEFLEMLNTVLDESVQKYKNTTDKSIELFRMSFIKKFIEDVWLLNDLKMDNSCYKRTVYLILRNMLEQLIEFIYLQKNPQYIEEYLGEQVDTVPFFDELHDIVKMSRALGKQRYISNRPLISSMAKSIGEYDSETGSLSLYDLYIVLSETCHNSYYMSLIDEYNSANKADNAGPTSSDQKNILVFMINVVLQKYNNN